MMPSSWPSPKRKRGSSEDPECPSPSPLASSPSSPRTAVAGRLGQLAIRGDRMPTPSPTPHPLREPVLEPTQCPPSMIWPGAPDINDLQDRPAPDCRPSSGPSEQAPDGGPSQPQDADASTAPSPRKKPAVSPRKKGSLVVTLKPRSRRTSSPPLPGSEEENPLTWHDSEITGHDPSDPNDDGYGINGIGFKPTAAIAWARSQKRQKQVSEWKTREAREARERRRERRDGIDCDGLRGVQKGAIQKKVKFDV